MGRTKTKLVPFKIPLWASSVTPRDFQVVMKQSSSSGVYPAGSQCLFVEDDNNDRDNEHHLE